MLNRQTTSRCERVSGQVRGFAEHQSRPKSQGLHVSSWYVHGPWSRQQSQNLPCKARSICPLLVLGPKHMYQLRLFGAPGFRVYLYYIPHSTCKAAHGSAPGMLEDALFSDLVGASIVTNVVVPYCGKYQVPQIYRKIILVST